MFRNMATRNEQTNPSQLFQVKSYISPVAAIPPRSMDRTPSTLDPLALAEASPRLHGHGGGPLSPSRMMAQLREGSTAP